MKGTMEVRCTHALLLSKPFGGFCAVKYRGKKVFSPELFIPNNLNSRVFVCFPMVERFASHDLAYAARNLSSGIRVALKSVEEDRKMLLVEMWI